MGRTMPARLRPRFLTGLCVAFVLGAATLPVAACPFCPSAAMSLAEQLSIAEGTLLVTWASAKPDTDDKPGSTTFQIQQVIKGIDGVKVGGKVVLNRYRSGKTGEMFLLMGADTGTERGVDWGDPLEVTQTSLKYILESPTPEIDPQERLAYFLKYLENVDPIIANDAFAEFANAQYTDVVALRQKLPREKLREWIVKPETLQVRIGFYGMLLGLCGDETDAKLLEQRILQPAGEFRLGVDGMIGGYLLIRGAAGLEVIERHKFRQKGVPFSETFAAMQALRFMWTYGDGKIAPERLRESQRVLLDNPNLTDLVIADLARWKDWSIQERLLAMYGKAPYETTQAKRAIIRFMLASTKDLPAGKPGATLPVHVVRGQAALAKLRQIDPKLVAEAERFFLSE